MNKLIINKVYANNFKGIPFKDIRTISDITFLDMIGKGLTVLSGPNGYGKTTLFDIVEIIFSKKITRFNSTKYGNGSIKDNGLLNDKTKNGLIGIELSNNFKTISILAKLPKGGGRGEIDTDIKSIEMFYYNGSLANLDKSAFINLSSANIKKIREFISIDDIKGIPGLSMYNSDTFNMFYYISQEESTHFLKEKENKKLSKLDSLVDIKRHIERSDFLDKLITDRQNGILKKRIKKINDMLNIKYSEINTEVNKVERVEFIKVFQNLDTEWNKKELEGESIEKLNNYKKEVDGTIELLNYAENVKNHLFNRKLDNLTVSEETFKDFLVLDKNKLIVESFRGIKNEEILEAIKKYEKNVSLQKLKEAYNEPELESKFEYSDLKKWGTYLDIEVSSNEIFNGIVNDIKTIKDRLDEGIRIYDGVKNKRTTFINSFKNAIKADVTNEYLNDKKCPICGTGFKDGELYIEIKKIEEYLNKATSVDQERLNVARKQLRDSIELHYIEVKDVEIVQDISDEDYKTLVKISKKERAQNNILEFFKNILELGLDISSDIKSFTSFVEYVKTKKYILSDAYLKANKDFQLQELYGKYYNSFFDEMLNNASLRSDLGQLSKYIQYYISMKENEKYKKIYNEIKDLVIQKKILEQTKEDLINYKKTIDTSIKSFRKKLINDIEIPLYLYTGKILQNYQMGLGVFINSKGDSVKFVPNPDDEHEIINSFSSGQLSGFIIAFMLVMNKVYTGREDILNAVLIDDPVQTMDDINIASLVEVLRNEFDDKQIILSSHEVNKVIYMMYKFSKYQINYEMKDVSRLVRPIN